MDDDKSTPISSLNNRGDDSEVVNQILNKYNDLGSSDGSLPPSNPNIRQMENQFENRNLNNEMFEHNSKNIAYKEHYENELKRSNEYQKKSNKVQFQDDDEDEDDDEYDEYEVIEIPLWRRILNEFRIPLFIIIFVIIFSNCSFDKQLIKRIPFFGNEFNECNTYGFLLKAFLIGIFSYILIKFVRF